MEKYAVEIGGSGYRPVCPEGLDALPAACGVCSGKDPIRPLKAVINFGVEPMAIRLYKAFCGFPGPLEHDGRREEPLSSGHHTQ